MNVTILKKHQNALKERELLRDRVEELGRELDSVSEYIQHAKEIETARKQARAGKVIPQDALFKEAKV